ncbi:MAG TPA: LamG domain-containing protein [Bacteroidetes bacterium]|nr:LamG domain-containing protein [Bacteroidota bacterium]
MKSKFRIMGALLLGAMLMTSLTMTSCKDDDPNPDDGKTDPSTIATENLVAYFPFDGDATEEIESLTPTMMPGVTYVTGRRGQAYQGADNAHLLYTLPANSKLKSLTSFTLAMWFKSPLVTGDPEPTVFEIGKSDDFFWGNLKFALNRLDATADSLQLKVFFLKSDAVAWTGQHISYSNSVFVTDMWMHLVLMYDEVTSKYMIYKDGVKIETNEGVENRWQAGDDVVPRPPLGPLSFQNADVLNIGAWRPKSEGTADDAWMGWFKGNLDELRVYDKALSAAEVKALYDAEVSQIE